MDLQGAFVKIGDFITFTGFSCGIPGEQAILRTNIEHKLFFFVKLSGTSGIPFVRIHSGNNSKIIFLCICICYEIENNSEIVSIC